MKDFDWTPFTKSRDDYKGDYHNHLIELYKTYVRSADNNSRRRQSSNTFYLTLNTGLIAFCGYRFNPDSDVNFLLILLGILGVALCYLWYGTLKSHKQLNTQKFNVILKIEKEFPIEPFEAEWELLEKGKNSKVYKEITKLEMKVPYAFGTSCVLMALGILGFMLWRC